jgi:hypothetical protein
VKIEIRSTDTGWTARHEQGRDGRHIVNVDNAERLTFAGVPMVRFHLADLPSDYPNPNVQVPAAWLVSAEEGDDMNTYRVNTPQFSYTITADSLANAIETAKGHAPELKRGWTIETKVTDRPEGPIGYVHVHNSKGRLITGAAVYESRD